LNVPEGKEETTIEEEMMTVEEKDTPEVEMTTWPRATVVLLTLIGVHQVTIEEVAETCHIIRMALDHPEITMALVISHATMIETAIMNPEAKEGKGKLFFILYLQLTNFFDQISIL